VVVSRIGGVPDALADGVEGLIVPVSDAAALADALCELLADPQRQRRMGAAGRARAVAEFDQAAVIARLDDLYSRLVAARTADRQRPA
jgi:glycosyltransferase involved in cell wall biosynthesis